jgi:uncharacterized protein (TIGR02266 family)
MVDYVSDAGMASDPATTLGAGGLFIETESPLHPGSRLKMHFHLPGSRQTHEIEGRVRWCKHPNDVGQHSPGMGIEFTDRNAMTLLARELESPTLPQQQRKRGRS